VTEFNYRMSDAQQAHVFVGLTTGVKGESHKIAAHFTKHGFEAMDLTHDELAKKSTSVTWWGGTPTWRKRSGCCVLIFPERPGALMRFLLAYAAWAGTSVCSITATRVLTTAAS
jgi:threonine dehydratase